MEENKKFKGWLDERNYLTTFKENEQLKKENMSMYILMEENNDLKKELDGYKNITYDKRMKKLVEENNYLQKRVGELLKEVNDLEISFDEAGSKAQKDSLEN